MSEGIAIAPDLYEVRLTLKDGERYPFHTLRAIDPDNSTFDWAEYAALGILRCLGDYGFEGFYIPASLDPATRTELFGWVADLIREAHAQRGNDNR